MSPESIGYNFDNKTILDCKIVEGFGFKCNTGVASREYLKDDIRIINHYEDGFLFRTSSMELGFMIKTVIDLQKALWDHSYKKYIDISK